MFDNFEVSSSSATRQRAPSVLIPKFQYRYRSQQLADPAARIPFRTFGFVNFSLKGSTRQTVTAMQSQDTPSSAGFVVHPFLRLPLEIRREVYRYFLVHDKEIVNPWLLIDFPSGRHPRAIEGLDPSILASCRFLHSETSDILYGDNVSVSLRHKISICVHR